MEFNEFKEHLKNHVNKMIKDHNFLFVTNIDKDTIWNNYLDSFPEGTNEIFRERREFDCSCCRQFVKSFGNVVVIENNKLISIWDFNTNDDKFQPVLNSMSNLIKSSPIRDVFVTKELGFGTEKNYEQLDNGEVRAWEHFRVDLPERFKNTSRKTVGSVIGEYRENKNVFKRSLEEISQDSIESILDLISQKSLYKGEEWKAVLEKFLNLHKEYSNLQDEKEKENYCWAKSVEIGGVISKIRNHSIGVLLTDITNGIELDEAVKRYERIVAPSNYKRPKAIFTKKMVEQAQQKVQELGLSL